MNTIVAQEMAIPYLAHFRNRAGGRQVEIVTRSSMKTFQPGDADGGYHVEHVVEGDDVSDVLKYVQWDRHTLTEKVRQVAEKALREGRITMEESARLRRRYKEGLEEYTYLQRDD